MWDKRPAPDASRLRRVVALASVQEGHSALDVGTGTGVLIPYILAAVGEAGAVVAFDLSRPMAAEARSKFTAANVSLFQADVHALPFPGASFDRVICNASFPHFEDRALGLSEMIRVLRPGGLLVISHPIGRAAVNARHRQAGGAVAGDRVPAPDVMADMLQQAGLTHVEVIDEPEFYLARGCKA
jgi:ubiquinone/menaquinone biosynthesis C-methylase UbiE